MLININESNKVKKKVMQKNENIMQKNIFKFHNILHNFLLKSDSYPKFRGWLIEISRV